MPISLAMARSVTPAVPWAAIWALATVLISSTVAWRTRSRRGGPSVVSVMLTAYGRVNNINNSEDHVRRDGRWRGTWGRARAIGMWWWGPAGGSGGRRGASWPALA